MKPESSTPLLGRIDEDGEWVVRQFVAPADLQRSPEEYVARHAHALGSFSFHLYRYADPRLGAWVRRVGELLASDEAVERCRRMYLPPTEAGEARRQDRDDL